jgi:hypothetical protein
MLPAEMLSSPEKKEHILIKPEPSDQVFTKILSGKSIIIVHQEMEITQTLNATWCLDVVQHLKIAIAKFIHLAYA